MYIKESMVEVTNLTKQYKNSKEFAGDIEQNNKRVKENPNYYRQRQQLAEQSMGNNKTADTKFI